MTPVNALGQPYRRKRELIFGNTAGLSLSCSFILEFRRCGAWQVQSWRPAVRLDVFS